MVVVLDLRSSTNVNTQENFASDRLEKAHRDLITGRILAFSFFAASAAIPTGTAVEAEDEAGDGDRTGVDEGMGEDEDEGEAEGEAGGEAEGEAEDEDE